MLHRYDRPDLAAFGTETSYSPSRCVNSSGTLYVVSDGSYDGMIQLDQNGDFLGYFGYNNNPITAWEYLQDLLFTDEMKAQLFSRCPIPSAMWTLTRKESYTASHNRQRETP